MYFWAGVSVTLNLLSSGLNDLCRTLISTPVKLGIYIGKSLRTISDFYDAVPTEDEIQHEWGKQTI